MPEGNCLCHLVCSCIKAAYKIELRHCPPSVGGGPPDPSFLSSFFSLCPTVPTQVYFPELRWTWQDLPLAGHGMKLQRYVSSYQALKTHSGEEPYACRVWVSLALLKTAANGYRDDSSLGAALNHREPHLPKGWLLTNDGLIWREKTSLLDSVGSKGSSQIQRCPSDDYFSAVNTLQVSSSSAQSSPQSPNKPLNSPCHCLSRESTLRHQKCIRTMDTALAISPLTNPSVYRIEALCGQNGQGLRKSAPQDTAENSYIGEALYGQGGRLRRFSNRLHLILHQRTLRKKT
ncbi:uncharacterized protein LOC111746083 [Pteropus vampyrus]|uniref:Uncharacterized protein LOC111746083 n=1 Tax=Pteropus vampyrus TaxID=132908 RepID=A0A6P6CZG7_PTEVA|nr:uncharacterized protein LOC111746083 [Pteropus vampyrus]